MGNNITEGIDAFVEKRRKENERMRQQTSYNFGSSFSILIIAGAPILASAISFLVWRYLLWKK